MTIEQLAEKISSLLKTPLTPYGLEQVKSLITAAMEEDRQKALEATCVKCGHVAKISVDVEALSGSWKKVIEEAKSAAYDECIQICSPMPIEGIHQYKGYTHGWNEASVMIQEEIRQRKEGLK